MSADLLARAAALPVPFSILSSLRFYRGRRGRGLPGTWFVELFAELGVTESAVRQTLYRLERQHVLATTKVGRTKFYAPTPSAEAAVDVGSEKLFRTASEGSWDGMWTVVHLQFGNERRDEQNRILDVLRVEGFAPMADGVFIHPRDRWRRVLDAARALEVDDAVMSFRSRRTDATDPRMTAAFWDLAVVRLAYERFLAAFEPHARRRARRVDPLHAFAGRLALVHEFLAAAWDDPDLPDELLPADWPADRARRVVQTLYERWRPLGLAFGDEIMARVTKRGTPAGAGTA